MPSAPLLERFIDDEVGRTPALISRVVAGTLQLLRDGRDSSASAVERSQCVELITALQQQTDIYQSRFVGSLATLLAAERQGGRPETNGDSKATGGLELMDETLVDVDIEISRAMQLIDTTAEWESRELQTFTSTLAGQSHVSADSNPFRPLVYATALWEAASAVVLAQSQRTMLLRLSSGVAAGLLKTAWAAACSRLESQGVEPGIYRTVLLPGATSRAPTVDVTRPGALGGLLSRMPVGSASGGRVTGADSPGAGPVRSAEFEEALRRLDELLQHLSLSDPAQPPQAAQAAAKRLALHRAALVSSAGDVGVRRVVELLSRIFETIIADPQIPPAARLVIARLQSPSLRVALHDPAMMDSHDHPVWRFVDRLGEASVAYPQAEDPRSVELLVCSRTLAEEIARAERPDAAIFRRALVSLEGFLVEQTHAQLRAATASVQALENSERRSALEQHLSNRLTDQMVSVRTSPSIRRFVTGTWAKVLAEAILRFGEQTETTGTYLKTVDDLLWSLNVPDHPQSRQRLVALLPVLLPRLRAGMELIVLPRPERQAFLDELMAIHAESLRPGGRAPAHQALTPAEIVQRMRDEVFGDAVPAPRPFADSVIDLSSMDTIPAEVLASEDDRQEGSEHQVDALRAGERVRLFIHGRWSQCQLLWRSEQGLFFLFAGDLAGRTHSITRRALERLGAAGLIQKFEPRSLLQRAVDLLMRELATRP